MTAAEKIAPLGQADVPAVDETLPPLLWEPGKTYFDFELDFDTTRAFLQFLDPRPSQRFVFARSVRVKNARGDLVDGMQPEYMTFEQFVRVAKTNQDAGWNYFVTINETRGARRKAEDVTHVRAHFCDFDKPPIATPEKHMPDVVVQSKHGEHWYWHTLAADDVAGWRRTQRMLNRHFGGDPSICDLPRVMRLPGCYHLKNLRDPFMVSITRNEPHNIVNRNMRRQVLGFQFDLKESPDDAEGGQVLKGDLVSPSSLTELPLHLQQLFYLFGLQNNHPVKERDGWLVRCPVHGDTNPSLKIMLQKDGALWLHCRGKRPECTSDAILAAVGTGWGLRYPENYRYPPKKET